METLGVFSQGVDRVENGWIERGMGMEVHGESGGPAGGFR